MDQKEYDYESVTCVNENLAERLISFLKYSEIEEAKSEYDKFSDSYQIMVDRKNYHKANNLVEIFMENETDDDEDTSDKIFSNIDNQQSDIVNSEKTIQDKDTNNTASNSSKKTKHDTYNDLEVDLTLYDTIDDKYKDNVSSAYTFLICGAAGLVVLLLENLNVINIITSTGWSNLIFNLILGGLFLAFIGIGIYSFKYSKSLKTKISKEKELAENILESLRTELSKDTIEDTISDDIPEEMKYYDRIDLIKSTILSKQPSIQDDAAIRIAEEYYTEIFG